MDIPAEFPALLASLTETFAIDGTRLTEPDILARLVLQLFLLMASAFFSSSETALFSLSQLDLQRLRRERHPRTNTLYRLLEQPRRRPGTGQLVLVSAISYFLFERPFFRLGSRRKPRPPGSNSS